MIQDLLERKEKKVEYIELIYDLIFVYIIGRNNSLLQHFSGGFVRPGAFFAYVLTTLAVIQIWNYTTYYINIYGRHGIREHVFLFVNMFLLYFVAEGTRSDWQRFHAQYHIAWALILLNISLQYILEFRNHTDGSQNRSHTLRMALILLGEAGLAVSDIWVYRAFHTTWLSMAAILLSMAAVVLFGQRKSGSFVDFPHLSERAMLYVVFTFGEMIIGTASYFEGRFSVRSTYFALMAFLIVVGLFLSYGVFYDHIIDREKKTNGLEYMFLHIFIIFAMNNITNSLEFMQEEAVELLPKMAFLIGSFILYFGFLYALGRKHAKIKCRNYSHLCLTGAAAGAIFAAVMYLLRSSMMLNIALTVIFIFSMFIMIYRYGKKMDSVSTPMK